MTTSTIESIIEEQLAAVAKAGGIPEPEAAKKAKPKKKIPKMELSPLINDGNTTFKDIFGELPPSGINHPGILWKTKDWDKDMQVDIPKVNEDYVLDMEAAEALWLAIFGKETPLIVGPTGCGKSELVKYFAAKLNWPYMRVNGKDGVEYSTFLGSVRVVGGEMVWCDGMLTQAVKKGYLFAFDEPFKVNAGIQMALQWLYEDEGRLVLDDMPDDGVNEKTIVPNERFRMVLADNVKGMGDDMIAFAATQVQDTSTLDRFGITIEMGYLKKDDEVALLAKKFPKIHEDTATKFVQLAGLVRNGYDKSELGLTMSPRALLKWSKYYSCTGNIGNALKMVYINKLSEDTEKSSISQLYYTVFGEAL